MNKITIDKKNRALIFMKAIRMTLLAILILVSIAGASPYAYITNDKNETVNVIDTAKDEIIASIPVGWSPYGVAVSPDGTKVYVGSWGAGCINIFDTSSYTVTATVPVGYAINGVEVSPDGKKLYVGRNDYANSFYVIDTVTNTVTKIVSLGDYGGQVLASKDGKKVYVTSAGGKSNVYVIDAVTNTVVATVPNVEGSNGEIALNPSGTKLYVANQNRETVSVIDTSTNNVITNFNVSSQPFGLAFNPSGTKLCVASLNGTYVINSVDNTVIATVPVGGLSSAVGFTPDGKKMYVDCNGNIYDINTTTNTVSNTLLGIAAVHPLTGHFIVNPPMPVVSPTANFSSNVRFGSAPLTVQFTDLSRNETSWSWNFGDGSTSTQRNPGHIYNKTGQFTVTLTAKNTVGSNSLTKTKFINVVDSFEAPVTAFSASPLSGKVPLNVSFSDQSTGSITAWKWLFGDGNNSTAQSPVFTYKKAGKYTVTLTTSNAAGSNMLTKTSYINVTS